MITLMCAAMTLPALAAAPPDTGASQTGTDTAWVTPTGDTGAVDSGSPATGDTAGTSTTSTTAGDTADTGTPEPEESRSGCASSLGGGAGACATGGPAGGALVVGLIGILAGCRRRSTAG